MSGTISATGSSMRRSRKARTSLSPHEPITPEKWPFNKFEERRNLGGICKAVLGVNGGERGILTYHRSTDPDDALARELGAMGLL